MMLRLRKDRKRGSGEAVHKKGPDQGCQPTTVQCLGKLFDQPMGGDNSGRHGKAREGARCEWLERGMDEL
jgi:hypothetical protein